MIITIIDPQECPDIFLMWIEKRFPFDVVKKDVF